MPSNAAFHGDDLPRVHGSGDLRRGLLDRTEFRIGVLNPYSGRAFYPQMAAELGQMLYDRHHDHNLLHGRNRATAPFAFNRAARWTRNGVAFGLRLSYPAENLWNLYLRVRLNGINLLKAALVERGLYRRADEPQRPDHANFIHPTCTPLAAEALSELCFELVTDVVRDAGEELRHYAITACGGEDIPQEAVVVRVHQIELAVDRWVRGIEIGTQDTDAGIWIRAAAPNWRARTGGLHRPEAGFEKLIAVRGDEKFKVYERGLESSAIRAEVERKGDATRELTSLAWCLGAAQFRTKVLDLVRPAFLEIVDALAVTAQPLNSDLFTAVAVLAGDHARSGFDATTFVRLFPILVRSGAFTAVSDREKKVCSQLGKLGHARYDARAHVWRPSERVLALLATHLRAEHFVSELDPSTSRVREPDAFPEGGRPSETERRASQPHGAER